MLIFCDVLEGQIHSKSLCCIELSPFIGFCSLELFLKNQGRRRHAIIWFPIDITQSHTYKEVIYTHLIFEGYHCIVPSWPSSKNAPLTLTRTTCPQATTPQLTISSTCDYRTYQIYINLHKHKSNNAPVIIKLT